MSSSTRSLAPSSSSPPARGGSRRKRRLEDGSDSEQKGDSQQHSDVKEEKRGLAQQSAPVSDGGSSSSSSVSVTVPHVPDGSIPPLPPPPARAGGAKPKKLTKTGLVSTAGEPVLTQPEALAVLELRYGDAKRRALFSSNNPRVQHRAWEELTAELEQRWGIKRTHKQLYDLIHDKTATYWSRCKVAEESGLEALKPWPYHAALQRLLGTSQPQSAAAFSSSSSSSSSGDAGVNGSQDASSSSSSSPAAQQDALGGLPPLPLLPTTAEQWMMELDVTRRILHKVIASIVPPIRPYNIMYEEAVREHAATQPARGQRQPPASGAGSARLR